MCTVCEVESRWYAKCSGAVGHLGTRERISSICPVLVLTWTHTFVKRYEILYMQACLKSFRVTITREHEILHGYACAYLWTRTPIYSGLMQFLQLSSHMFCGREEKLKKTHTISVSLRESQPTWLVTLVSRMSKDVLHLFRCPGNIYCLGSRLMWKQQKSLT